MRRLYTKKKEKHTQRTVFNIELSVRKFQLLFVIQSMLMHETHLGCRHYCFRYNLADLYSIFLFLLLFLFFYFDEF